MANANGETPLRGGKAAARKTKNKKKASVGLILFRIVLVLMLMILFAIVGYGVSLLLKAQDTIQQIGTPDPVAPEEKASERPLSFLLLGTDYREVLRSANTDVIMIASLNPNSKTATLVSIPRDTYIDPADLSAAKANSFYAAYLYGNLKDAPKDRDERQKFAMQRVKGLFGDFLDINIDYVAVVDFQTFVDVVDAYGGLVIDVDQNMCHRDSADGTNINLKKGVQQLDGKQTLDFVRYRKSMNCSPKTKESNDFERNARQQQVISKLLDKVKTPQGVLKLTSVFDAVSKNVKTDIPTKQIQSLIETYITIDLDKIEYVHLEGPWDGRYVRLAEEDVKMASDKLKAQLRPEGPPQDEPEDADGDAAAAGADKAGADGSASGTAAAGTAAR